MFKLTRSNSRIFFVVSMISLIALVGAALNLPLRTAVAQGGKTVKYDTPVESEISDANFSESWTLDVQAKDRVSITVDRTGGTLVPRVELRDSNNQRVAGADYDETGASATISYVDFPGPGTYTVFVSRWQDEDGKTTGNYKLTVALLGTAEDSPALKLNPSAIEFDKPATGELTNARWKEGWTFSATAKDVVTITAARTDGTVRPQLDLLDSSGNSITQGYLGPTGDSAKIAHYKLPGPGQYTVVVLRENKRDGKSAGKYSLTVALDGAGPERPELNTPQGPVTNDATVNGTLTNAKWIDVWTLDAQAKDDVLITATRTDGNLMPVVYLFGANNQEIQRGYPRDDGDSAQIETVLPGPGKYEVRVARTDNENGLTTGKYELSVALQGAGEDSPAFKTSAGEVQIGTPVKGTLTNAKWQDSWSFNAQTADPLNIVVRRTSGTLIPNFKILGANQQEITSASADSTLAQAGFDQRQLPGPGQYTIVVYRYNGTRGATSGGYELSITQGQKQ
jgi:uncharacterized protein (DUF2141 family)